MSGGAVGPLSSRSSGVVAGTAPGAGPFGQGSDGLFQNKYAGLARATIPQSSSPVAAKKKSSFSLLGDTGNHAVNLMGDVRGVMSNSLKICSETGVIDGTPMGVKYLGAFSGVCGLFKGADLGLRGICGLKSAVPAHDESGIAINTFAVGLGVTTLMRAVLDFVKFVLEVVLKFVALTVAAMGCIKDALSVVGLVGTVVGIICWGFYSIRSILKTAEFVRVENELNAMAKEVICEVHGQNAQTILQFHEDSDYTRVFSGACEMIKNDSCLEDAFLRKIDALCKTDEKFKARFDRTSNQASALSSYVEKSDKTGPNEAEAKKIVYEGISKTMKAGKKQEIGEIVLFTAMFLLSVVGLIVSFACPGVGPALIIAAVGLLITAGFLLKNNIKGYRTCVGDPKKESRYTRAIMATTMVAMALVLIATFVFTGGAGILPLVVLGVGGGLLLLIQAGVVFYKRKAKKSSGESEVTGGTPDRPDAANIGDIGSLAAMGADFGDFCGCG